MNLLYHLKLHKVNTWKNNDGNLSFSFDKKAGLLDHLRDSLAKHKAELLEVLTFNNIYSEETFKNTAFYKIPVSLQQNALSPIQSGIYIQSKLDLAKYAYNIPVFIRLEEVDTQILKKALVYLLTKHPILRMSVCKGLKYKILNTEEFKVKEDYDIEANDIKRVCNDKKYYEFNLDGGILINFEIVRIKNSNDCLLNLTHHHILTDGYSLLLIVSEILSIYSKLCHGELTFIDSPLIRPINYFDYIAYQNYELQTENYKSAIEYLCNKLDNAEPLQLKKTNLIFDNQGEFFNFKLDTGVYTTLMKVALDRHVSLYSILLTSLYHVLSTYAGGQVNFPIGLTVSNRPMELSNVIGPFISTLPLIPEYNTEDNFIDNIKRFNKEVIFLNEYQQINLNILTEGLKRSNQDIADLMHIMFTMHNYRKEIGCTSQIKFEIVETQEIAEKFGISIVAEEKADGLSFSISYAKSLYSENYIKSIFNSFIHLLSQINHINLAKPINKINLLNNEDYYRVIYEWNATDSDYPRNKTIHQLFEEQVNKTPDNIAVIHEDTRLTYKELNERANQLANYIRQIQDIKPDTLIVLCLDRSEYMLVSILAVLKAGGAYVPMDPSCPDERIQYIFKDTAAKLILTNEVHKQRLLDLAGYSNLSIETITINSQATRAELLLQQADNLKTETKSTDLAYVIYTSGTTGSPKGVMIEHIGVANLAIAQAKELGLTEIENIKNCLWYSNYVFDAHVSEVYTSILNGHAIHIINNDIRLDIEQLSTYIQDNSIIIATIPPALLNNRNILKLNTLVVAGEKTDQTILDYYQNNNIQVINAYGPSEVTVCASLNHYHYNGAANIGSPLSNIKCYVLDINLKPLPIAAIGELYISGAGIARGYLNKPDLTAKKFIPNPFQTEEEKNYSKNARLYKTGDLVRWLPDGNIEYIGRNDFQVKIRGYRIELGEIENALLSYEGIKQSAVLAKEHKDERRESTGNKYLVGYYVADGKFNEKDILNFLQKKLPSYMVPNILVHRASSLPLTINGKLDVKVLPEPQFTDKDNYVAPRNELEKKLCKIWGEVLGVSQDKVGTHDDFFKLGGNSILAIKLVKRINCRFKSDLKISDIFVHKNIESLSQVIKPKGNYRAIIKLNNTFEKPNIFMIHAGLGGCEIYASLANALANSFCCYGVESYNLYHESKISNLRELARYYLSYIDKIMIDTNQEIYYLLGWSLGGQISLEIACLLEERGDIMIKVYLLDTFLNDDYLLSLRNDKYTEKLKNAYKNYAILQEYDILHIEKIISNIETENELAKQRISSTLVNTKVVLFKAMLEDTRFKTDYSKKNYKYCSMIEYNNVDNVISHKSNIKLIKISDADHGNILKKEELLVLAISEY